MRYGIYLPNYGKNASAAAIAELAYQTEQHGWDGFFIWDHILAHKIQKVPLLDPWVTLAAAATRTQQIKIGTTVTPVARRRPWKLARETATLDHLSEGRLILSVGLGEPGDVEFRYFGEEADPRIRAEKLDEGLEILAGLWRGEPFSFKGKHFQIEEMRFLPPSLQQPRIPIWVGGFWPNKAPFRRAARWDGAFPLLSQGKTWTIKTLNEIKAFITAHRETYHPFDIVRLGTSTGKTPDQQRKLILPLKNAGLTWWLENLYTARDDYDHALRRIQQGPPQVE